MFWRLRSLSISLCREKVENFLSAGQAGEICYKLDCSLQSLCLWVEMPDFSFSQHTEIVFIDEY